MSSFIRILARYSREDETFIDHQELKDIPLPILQNLFGVPQDDPMFDCYEVKPEHLQELQQFVDNEIELGGYWYYVEVLSS